MTLQKLFDGTIVNLGDVVLVYPCGGDSDWLRYTVKLKQNQILEIYETRQYAENKKLPQMPREEFMSALNKHKEDLASVFDLDLFQDNDTGFMVLAALRYCHGRMSYAPSLMVEWVKKYWEYISPNNQELIRKETREYMKSSLSKGIECDRLTWQDFADWIEIN